MKKITLTAGLILSVSTTAFAADVTIPNTFTAGSPAVAADVNANFSAVKTAVDDNNARVTTNSTNITNATNGISANTASAATNASGVASNAANISTNSSTAVINAAGVASNASNIGTQGSSIATNAANISSNTASSSTNAGNISSNTGSISNNAADISTNAAGIAANSLGIAGNTTGVSNNTSNIATNTAAIAAIPSVTIYDYRDYLSTASSKTFALTTSATCGDTETRSYVRTANGADTDIAMTRQRFNGGTLCNYNVFNYTHTSTERLLKSRDQYDTGGGVLGSLTNFHRIEDPIAVRSSSMAKGQSFTDASKVFITPAGGSETFNGVHINSAYAAATETVTVPLGTYNNCLKFHEQRNSATFGNELMRTSWHCPGVGMVKRIELKFGGTYFIHELTAITP